jgi:hypothetical protein
MSKEKSVKEEPKEGQVVSNEQVISEEDAAKKFVGEYQVLCKKHGFQLVVVPTFKPRDDGTFSVVLQTSIGKLPAEN